MVQLPLEQAGVPLATMHSAPQPPQLLGSTPMLVSQPSTAAPLQSAQPALQAATVQLPAAPAGTALGRLHAAPQPPQFAASVRMSCSQPLAALPSQSAKPALQLAITHAPPEQAPTA